MNVSFSALYDTSGAPVEADVVDVGNALLFTREQLEETPSMREGVSSGMEEKLRVMACEVIHGVLTLCGVDRTVICTAHVYLHRYYCQRSVLAFNFKYVALGVIYLALKTEETNITEEDLIPVFCRFLERAYLSEERSDEELGWIGGRSSEYDLWWDWLVCLEMDILIAFGFRLHVARPHKLMFTYMQKLQLTQVMQEAWITLNDSYFTTACIRYRSEVLACGAIFYVARKHKIALPEGGRYPWWELFGASERELHEFALLMTELYDRPEDDFDFTRDIDLEFRNDRADGIKRPHPVYVQRQTQAVEDAPKDVIAPSPVQTDLAMDEGDSKAKSTHRRERHRDMSASPHRSHKKHRRRDSSRDRGHRSSRRDHDSNRHSRSDRERSSRRR